MDKRLLVLLLILTGCAPFSDYSEKEEGVYMKLYSFEEGDQSFRPGFYKEASVKVKNGDQLIFRNYKEQLISSDDKRLNFLFEHLVEGDSAHFKVSTDRFKTIFNDKNSIVLDEYYDVEIKVYNYYERQPKFIDPEMHEQIILKKYLNEHQNTIQKNGVYIEQIKKGSGTEIKRDKVVTIHYVGRFINHLEFDNTYKSSAFTFTYGTPSQVIPGLEKALNGMKAGEKAKIIIPSQLAFKDDGSSTQVVPPFSTVIYELEIVNVK